MDKKFDKKDVKVDFSSGGWLSTSKWFWCVLGVIIIAGVVVTW